MKSMKPISHGIKKKGKKTKFVTSTRSEGRKEMSTLEYRKLQEIQKKGFNLNLPIEFCRNLGLKKHDLILCRFEDQRIVIQKAFHNLRSEA